MSNYQHSISQKIASENVWSATSKFLASFFFFFWFLFWGKFSDFAKVANVCSKNIFYNGKNFISLVSRNQRKVRRKKDLWGRRGAL